MNHRIASNSTRVLNTWNPSIVLPRPQSMFLLIVATRFPLVPWNWPKLALLGSSGFVHSGPSISGGWPPAKFSAQAAGHNALPDGAHILSSLRKGGLHRI